MTFQFSGDGKGVFDLHLIDFIANENITNVSQCFSWPLKYVLFVLIETLRAELVSRDVACLVDGDLITMFILLLQG